MLGKLNIRLTLKYNYQNKVNKARLKRIKIDEELAASY